MSPVMDAPAAVQHVETMQANPVCDVMSSGRRAVSSLTPEEKIGLRRIVREPNAPTPGLRSLMASAKMPLNLISKR